MVKTKDNAESLVRKVRELNKNIPTLQVRNPETILAEAVSQHGGENNGGHAEEIFRVWERSSDRHAVEQMFRAFTGMEFEEYLEKCRDILDRQQSLIAEYNNQQKDMDINRKDRQKKGESLIENIGAIVEVLDSLGWHFSFEPKEDGYGYWYSEINIRLSGADFTAALCFDGTVRDFIREIRQSFDLDEEVILVNGRTKTKIPGSIGYSIERAEEIRKNLDILADALEEWADERDLPN